jgi:tripartite-type tricarboxylate transporter receptor subunit TctC
MNRLFLLVASLASFFTYVCSDGVSAQTAKGGEKEFPTRPVTLIIPLGAGGSHDMTGRAVTSVAVNYLGQPIIIQLKPGGGGAIGAEIVAKSPPDGYTLLFGGPGGNTTLPAIEGRSKGPDELAAVCRINYSPIIIACRSDMPFKTFKEMLAYAKANPDKLIFANTGPWGAADLPWKMIVKQTGIKAKNVPYDGGGPALLAILGGHADVIGGLTAYVYPNVKSGKLRALAVLDHKRDETLPDVPTAKEEGVDVVNLMWRGVLAPKNTPRPVIEKLAHAFKQMTEDKTVVSMIHQLGDEIQYLGPDEFTKVWREEFESQKELGKYLKK